MRPKPARAASPWALRLTLLLLLLPLAAPVAAGAAHPLRTLLAVDDNDAERGLILQEVARLPGAPCPPRVTGYAADPAASVREHAVQALADAGCASFDAYRPFTPDPDPWVAETLIEAVERRRIAAAVPFLLERLADPRTIVSSEGTWTLGERAHRALRVVSCHSFHYNAAGTPEGQADAVAQWRAWYESHRDEPRAAWIDSGLRQARDYLARDYEPHRREGFELLALIGAPAIPTLRAALRHGPDDIRASLSCPPAPAPRVGEPVSCLLRLVNVSSRRVALALGAAEIRLEHATAAAPAAPRARRPSSPARDRDGGGETAPDAALLEAAGHLVDLAPGGALQKEIVAGPVETAGDYVLRVRLPDRAGPDAPTVETRLRFRL